MMRRNGHRGSMSVGASVCLSVLPSMPKGEIVVQLVFIDVNP
jgi:hypothetical protein